jgi:LmbE family N-acetylglucosaminyl deacetylase
MIDHEETSRLVRNACFIAPIPNYNSGKGTKPSSRVPFLYYWNAIGLRDIFGRPLPLTCAVDITSVMEIKTQMLAGHVSQAAWLAHHHKDNQYLATMWTTAQKEGARSGFKFAEGFIQHRGSGYPQDNLLTTILKKECREFSPGRTSRRK